MPAPDYSEWLTAERLVQIEKDWAAMDRVGLIAAIMKHEPKTVVEFCCGTGWIPKGLPKDVEYHGFDANPHCLTLARQKNQDETRGFTRANVIELTYHAVTDMALAFSCLKHFTLADWDAVYGLILRAGRRTLTSIFRGVEREDESHGFPHTRVSMERVERVVDAHGHRIVDIFTLPPLNVEPEPLILTELKLKVVGFHRDSEFLL